LRLQKHRSRSMQTVFLGLFFVHYVAGCVQRNSFYLYVHWLVVVCDMMMSSAADDVGWHGKYNARLQNVSWPRVLSWNSSSRNVSHQHYESFAHAVCFVCHVTFLCALTHHLNDVTAATSRQCHIFWVAWPNSTVVYTLQTRLLLIGWCCKAHRSIRTNIQNSHDVYDVYGACNVGHVDIVDGDFLGSL